MKLSGVLSIILAFVVFFSAVAMISMINNEGDALTMVFLVFIFASIYLLIDGFSKIRTANRLRNLEQKFLYVSGLAGSDYLGDR